VQGTYLIRYSAEAPGFMALTVLQDGEPAIKHYRIQHKYAPPPAYSACLIPPQDLLTLFPLLLRGCHQGWAGLCAG
jgi:hypothetical protein